VASGHGQSVPVRQNRSPLTTGRNLKRASSPVIQTRVAKGNRMTATGLTRKNQVMGEAARTLRNCMATAMDL
jgi:hypothetical protein